MHKRQENKTEARLKLIIEDFILNIIINKNKKKITEIVRDYMVWKCLEIVMTVFIELLNKSESNSEGVLLE